MTAYLITGASIVGGEVADLLIDNGEIVATGTGTGLDAPADVTTIDAAGLIALPGLVDLHTHLREPGREDAETVFTGTRAAAQGGFTAVFAMANTDPVADTAGVVEQVWRLGRDAGYADVFPIGAVIRLMRRHVQDFAHELEIEVQQERSVEEQEVLPPAL